jgi:hypothetical protein
MRNILNNQRLQFNSRIFLTLLIILFSFQGIFFLTPGSTGQINVLVNGKRLDNASAFIESGRTLVPCRVIAEALGAFVNWDNETRTVIIERKKDSFQLAPDSTIAFKNGEQIVLDVPGKIVGDRLYVPLRIIAESLGAKVIWDEPRSTVLIEDYCPYCVP